MPSRHEETKTKSLLNKLTDHYWPITNVPFLTKAFEKLDFEQITKYTKDSNLFDSRQSDYRKFHSSEIALLHVSSYVVRLLDCG